jgi:hypothetical protein
MFPGKGPRKRAFCFWGIFSANRAASFALCAVKSFFTAKAAKFAKKIF